MSIVSPQKGKNATKSVIEEEFSNIVSQTINLTLSSDTVAQYKEHYNQMLITVNKQIWNEQQKLQLKLMQQNMELNIKLHEQKQTPNPHGQPNIPTALLPKITIKQYDPQNALGDWLDESAADFKVMGYPDSEIIRNLCCHIPQKSELRNYIEDNILPTISQTTWAKFREQIIKLFPEHAQSYKKHQELINFSFLPNETVDIARYRFINMCARAGYAEINPILWNLFISEKSLPQHLHSQCIVEKIHLAASWEEVLKKLKEAEFTINNNSSTSMYNNRKNTNMKKINLPCKYFAKGRCYHGDKCRFKHDKSENKAEKRVEVKADNKVEKKEEIQP
jgi:hypothetical protein